MQNDILASLRQLTDAELVERVKTLATEERQATAQLVAHLAELDTRDVYLRSGYGSLFAYCREALSLSEHEAYNRIEVARAARRFPVILELLATGSVTLTAVRLVAPHLTPENHRGVLESARGRRKAEVGEIVAALSPRPDVTSSVRKLPAPRSATPRPTGASGPPVPSALRAPALPLPASPGAVLVPLSPNRYKVQVTIGGETLEKLRLAKDLLRHAIPSGDEAAILDRALTALLADLAKRKFGATDKPQQPRPLAKGSRDIPAHVKRAVSLRDLGRCAFVGADGRRCARVLGVPSCSPVCGGRRSNCREHPVEMWPPQSLRSASVLWKGRPQGRAGSRKEESKPYAGERVGACGRKLVPERARSPMKRSLGISHFTIRDQGGLRYARCDDVPAVMVVAGPNGVGKSSLLEAIHRKQGEIGRERAKVFYFPPHRVVRPQRVQRRHLEPQMSSDGPLERAFSAWKVEQSEGVTVGGDGDRTRTSVDEAGALIKKTLARLQDRRTAVACRLLDSRKATDPLPVWPDVFEPFRSLVAQLLPHLAFEAVDFFDEGGVQCVFRRTDAVGSGTVELDWLSSGEKAVLLLLLPVIENEMLDIVRSLGPSAVPDPPSEARDFAVTVLIDEPEQHLHPELLRRLVGICRNARGGAQGAVHLRHAVPSSR